jgi:nucleotide-binding universal stress UspA family protein
MKILVAIDGSPSSETAVDEVAARPWPSNSEFRILSAFQIPLNPTPEPWVISPAYCDAMEQAAREQARKLVDAASARLQESLGKSVNVTTEILPGSPQAIILAEAERWKTDLIVMGSHGYGTWHRLLLGSVSQAVVSHAKCSVEVARHRDPTG